LSNLGTVIVFKLVGRLLTLLGDVYDARGWETMS